MNYKIIFTAIVSATITTAHTFFISRSFYIGLIITSFSISMLSAMHVKWLNDGKMSTRVLYSIGATVGVLVGLYLSSMLLKR